MKISAKALPLLLEFIGAAALSVVTYAALLRSGLQVFGALGVGFTYAAIVAVARPNYVAQLNPIVTLGLWMARRLSSMRTFVTILVQMLGGVVAWQLSELILDRPLSSLAGDKFDWQIFTAELLGAFVFTFLLSMVLFKNKLDDTKLVFVAFASVTVGMIIASLAQGGYGLINPSIAVGIQSWGWTFILGPLAGGFLGMNVIPFLDMLDKRAAKKSNKKTTKKSTATKRTTTKKK